ncbi:hypothetical protein J6TS1_27280 [Siminovitchia terrae]|uniref:O-antigen ligase-related domain-containing protein n=1 Tax=Siminovitchia terrae TaxID=1914933 RepID=A0ABQ4KXU0_SIMTE|nr:O-antigen ligase family protein [Siminovitchia terrae]GIN96858.1 hypothetical protein J6TS1_27280 [Siminovitchia terrae]
MDTEQKSIGIGNKKREKIPLSIIMFGLFLVFVFMCNDRYLNITDYTIFLIIACFFCALEWFISDKLHFKIEHFCSFFLIAYLLVSLYQIDITANSGIYLSYLLFLVFFILITIKKIKKQEIRFIINSYIASATIISLSIIIFRNEFMGWTGTFRYTIRYSNQEYADPNFIAAYIYIAALFCIYKLLLVPKKSNKIIYSILAIVITTATLFTGSRAAMIGLVIGCIPLVLKGKKSLLISVISLSSIGFFMFMFLPEGLKARMFYNTYIDDSNITRMSLWMNGIEAFVKKPMIGYGPQYPLTIINEHVGVSRAIHNTFIAFLVQFGLLGIVPLIIIIINPLRNLLNRSMFPLLGLYASWFFTLFMVEANVSIIFWSTITIITLIANYKKENPNSSILDII